MKQLPRRKKTEYLSGLFWDMEINPEKMLDYLEGKESESAIPVDSTHLYRRILSTLDWYTILKIVPDDQIPRLLQDKVISGLFPKELKMKYLYVKSILRR